MLEIQVKWIHKLWQQRKKQQQKNQLQKRNNQLKHNFFFKFPIYHFLNNLTWDDRHEHLPKYCSYPVNL